MSAQEFFDRWSHIARFLRFDAATGRVRDEFLAYCCVEDQLSPAEQAVALDEWADFYEWRQAQRTDDPATDRVTRHLVAEWTDSMAYLCRRRATIARGEDPGAWQPQSERRPDLDTERHEIVAGLGSIALAG